jgi:hypothetical protein
MAIALSAAQCTGRLEAPDGKAEKKIVSPVIAPIRAIFCGHGSLANLA